MIETDDERAERRLRRAKANIAVNRVGVAIKRGHLVRQPCEECGATTAQAHHHNGYEREHWLDVVWLCLPHHQQRHKADKP